MSQTWFSRAKTRRAIMLLLRLFWMIKVQGHVYFYALFFIIQINHFFSFPFYRSNVFSGVPQGARSGPLSADLTSNLPEYWDWRLYGAVSQVKDQVVQSQSQSIIYTNLCRKQFQVANSWRDFPAHNWSLNAITEFINALKFLTLLKC